MVTIKDVAKEAGVSVGTVSAVINGYKSVKSANFKKVSQAIEKLDYKPNMMARALKTGISMSFGLVIPDITNPYYPEVARSVEDAARQEGFTVFLCNSDRDAAKEKDYINALISKNVVGIIITKPRMSFKDLVSLQETCNLVLVDTTEEMKECFNVVNINDADGVRDGMNMLFEYGHEKIAYVSGLLESNSAINRFNAYKESLKANGIRYRSEYVKTMQYDWFSGYTAAIELLRLSEVPTAIFAANDLIAMGVLKALQERNVNVPLDISVMGFDDIDQSSYCIPPLTTVRQPKYELGLASVNILINRFRDPDKTDECVAVDLNTELIRRESVNYAKSAIKLNNQKKR